MCVTCTAPTASRVESSRTRGRTPECLLLLLMQRISFSYPITLPLRALAVYNYIY